MLLQVRYDRSNCTKDMRIKFMTDGILLREAGRIHLTAGGLLPLAGVDPVDPFIL